MTPQVYRAFRISEVGHIMAPPEVIVCDTDAEAIEQATKLTVHRDDGIQLWHANALCPPHATRLTGDCVVNAPRKSGYVTIRSPVLSWCSCHNS
jgi:hypothetical protein